MPGRGRLPVAEGATAAAPRRSVEQFRVHLLERIPDAARAKLRSVNPAETAAANGLRELWEKSDLSGGKFADEVAGFWRLPRLGLQELINAVGAVEQFSPRFLRESSVFPFRTGDDGFGLAVSDPADGAAIRAAEIVCGRAVTIAVASFDDITTVLELRLDERTTGAVVDEPEQRTGDDDIDSLRDLASGAPVVRAVSDLLERAMELRASDIHGVGRSLIEPPLQNRCDVVEGSDSDRDGTAADDLRGSDRSAIGRIRHGEAETVVLDSKRKDGRFT